MCPPKKIELINPKFRVWRLFGMSFHSRTWLNHRVPPFKLVFSLMLSQPQSKWSEQVEKGCRRKLNAIRVLNGKWVKSTPNVNVWRLYCSKAWLKCSVKLWPSQRRCKASTNWQVANTMTQRRCFPLSQVVLQWVRLSSTDATGVAALTLLCATALTKNSCRTGCHTCVWGI